jgi:alcohol dehydrogenase class IV
MDMDMTRIHTFHAPTRLVFGVNAAGQVGAEVTALGAAGVLLVTDPGIEQAGLLTPVIDSLAAAGIAVSVFKEVEPNPTDSTCQKGLAAYQAAGAGAIVAVGGGSAMDAAKGIGLLASFGGRIQDYEGPGKVPGAIVPLLAVPTTCGTGSEATHISVITDPARSWKMSLASPHLAPRTAVIDPLLYVKLPAHIIAATGMDALTHAIESYTNRWAEPFADALDIEAIRMIGGHIRVAVANGNLDAMTNMALGATMAGMAFTNTILGIVHAMSHPITCYYGVPHGIANAILLPTIMEFNLIGAPHRFARIAAALGEPVDGLSVMEAARRSVEAVRDLNDDLGIPADFRDTPFTDDIIEKMADDAMKSRNIQINPRRVTRAQIVELFKQIGQFDDWNDDEDDDTI